MAKDVDDRIGISLCAPAAKMWVVSVGAYNNDSNPSSIEFDTKLFPVLALRAMAMEREGDIQCLCYFGEEDGITTPHEAFGSLPNYAYEILVDPGFTSELRDQKVNEIIEKLKPEALAGLGEKNRLAMRGQP